MLHKLVIQLAAFSIVSIAYARDLPVPHGSDVRSIAANCPVGSGEGDLGKTGKAGEYNEYCEALTDAEVCLALMKGSVLRSGELVQSFLPAKAKVCLEEFTKTLLAE